MTLLGGRRSSGKLNALLSAGPLLGPERDRNQREHHQQGVERERRLANGNNRRFDRDSSSIDGPKALASIEMTVPTPSGTIEAAAIATIHRCLEEGGGAPRDDTHPTTAASVHPRPPATAAARMTLTVRSGADPAMIAGGKPPISAPTMPPRIAGPTVLTDASRGGRPAERRRPGLSKTWQKTSPSTSSRGQV